MCVRMYITVNHLWSSHYGSDGEPKEFDKFNYGRCTLEEYGLEHYNKPPYLHSSIIDSGYNSRISYPNSLTSGEKLPHGCSKIKKYHVLKNSSKKDFKNVDSDKFFLVRNSRRSALNSRAINEKCKADNVPLMSQRHEKQDSERNRNILLKNDLPNVIIVEAKQKELCPLQEVCEPTPKVVHCADSNCYKTTPNLQYFRELNEGKLGEDDITEFNDTYKRNSKWAKELSAPLDNTQSQCLQTDTKGEINTPDKVHPNKQNKLLRKNKKSIEAGRIKRALDKENDLALLKDESEINLEKGNKRVENKILEGFINSIIANYSREGGKATTQEPMENNEKSDDGDAVIRLIKDNSNKKKIDDSDNINLMSIIIPDSKDHFKDNEEFSKLGPFSEEDIKQLLNKIHFT